MAKIPAYFTVAFDFKGAVKIQQIQYREVLEVDGELTEVKQYPPDLIKAPQDNDLITGLLKDASDAIAAGAIKAVAEAQADRVAGIAAAEALHADRVLELKAKATAAEEKFGAVEGQRIEALLVDVATKDANIQALLAQVADLEAALNCDRCQGKGWTGYQDQSVDCPDCAPTREAAKAAAK